MTPNGIKARKPQTTMVMMMEVLRRFSVNIMVFIFDSPLIYLPYHKFKISQEQKTLDMKFLSSYDMMMAQKANFDAFDRQDFIRFLGAKAKLARKVMSGLDNVDDEDTLIYRNDTYAKDGFFIRIMVFDPLSKRTYYEVLVVTPKHSKTFYGEDLLDIEMDVLYFMRNIRSELDIAS